ncbi:MAG: DUF4325 domain-containing protein [bacterium]
MTRRVRARGEAIRRFILEQVERSPEDVSKAVAERFNISRQAVNKHLRILEGEGVLSRTGRTRASVYQLAPLMEWHNIYEIKQGLAEDVVWRDEVKGVLGALPDNVLGIWSYGFTEILNNAIDHSSGSIISVEVKKTATTTEMMVGDDGLGIFRKIQAALGLLDERHAVLELSKGKLTTDPKHHTGEGIFFTSRMMDSFGILSGGVYLSHSFGEAEDWILEGAESSSGTSVWMKLSNHTARTTAKVFEQFSSGEEFGFTKTVVPVRLAQYGEDQLISRSQARRLLARVEQFKTVVFDFQGVELIGQAFADEIFRVFALQHSEIVLIPIRANSAVKRVIERARQETRS